MFVCVCVCVCVCVRDRGGERERESFDASTKKTRGEYFYCGSILILLIKLEKMI